jgi:DNA-binding response OmpR family regulator
MDRSLKILLIEDNPGDAFLIKFYFEESVLKNAGIVHAEYLKTALDLLSKNDFDIIILDLNLPDSNGISTLSEVLEKRKDAVVIVLTGLQDEELGNETVRMGAQDYLVKGQFDGKVFTSSIRYAFESARLKKELTKVEFRLKVVQQLSGCGYWKINLNDKSIYCSEQFIRMLGLKKNIQTVNAFLDLFAKEEHDKINNVILSAPRKKEETLKVKMKNGKSATLSATTNERFDNDDVIAGILKLN